MRWLAGPRPVQLRSGAGLANGYRDGTFRPNRSVTRAQLVRWLHHLALAGTA